MRNIYGASWFTIDQNEEGVDGADTGYRRIGHLGCQFAGKIGLVAHGYRCPRRGAGIGEDIGRRHSTGCEARQGKVVETARYVTKGVGLDAHVH